MGALRLLRVFYRIVRFILRPSRTMQFLNLHHLRYFWMVAREKSLRRAAERMNVSQPTISAQIAALEAACGHQLFLRGPRGLALTDAGHLAFGYAEEIFALGEDLLSSLKQRPTSRPLRVHIGIADSLPKLVSHQIIRPVFALDRPVRAVCVENKTADLLAQLAVHRLDLVLCDEPAPSAAPARMFNHLLGESDVAFCANPELARRLGRGFPRSLHEQPMLLPSAGSALRRSLEKWFHDGSIRPRVVAEYDDLALMKVAAEDGLGCFPLPTVATREALERYGFRVFGKAEGCRVQYFAVSIDRRLAHPAVAAITAHAQDALFGPRANLGPTPSRRRSSSPLRPS